MRVSAIKVQARRSELNLVNESWLIQMTFIKSTVWCSRNLWIFRDSFSHLFIRLFILLIVYYIWTWFARIYTKKKKNTFSGSRKKEKRQSDRPISRQMSRKSISNRLIQFNWKLQWNVTPRTRSTFIIHITLQDLLPFYRTQHLWQLPSDFQKRIIILKNHLESF